MLTCTWLWGEEGSWRSEAQKSRDQTESLLQPSGDPGEEPGAQRKRARLEMVSGQEVV